MNPRQLEKIGVPRTSARYAIQAVQQLVAREKLSKSELRERIARVVENPGLFIGDDVFDPLARELLEEEAFTPQEPVDYRTWGTQIDGGVHSQMRQACAVPSAIAAAVMPDAHVGYGLPIGGVLGLENAVIPYAVGVDIACRMKISVLDTPPEHMDRRLEHHKAALIGGTRFGVGCTHETPQHHDVLDRDWTITRITREHRDRARSQLGTSGSGNHFVEFGTLTVTEQQKELGLEPGTYSALLSHSGSRGVGAAVCNTYSGTARRMLPKRHEDFGRLAWLDMDSQEGREYWEAMNLMGHYAAANHDVIHRLVTRLLGARVIAQVENHHNFAWKEQHFGRDLIVHRKGATPAGTGVPGIIPGSMADPAFVVRGRGSEASLKSAAHGAGRAMSRTAAKARFSFRSVRNTLAKRGITVLSAGADEVPGVYKDIHQVMAEQADLVEVVARFDPKIVRMCGDGSRAED